MDPQAILNEIRNEAAEYEAAVAVLAEIALKDFDYPTADRAGRAQDELGDAIKAAIDRWVEANCNF